MLYMSTLIFKFLADC